MAEIDPGDVPQPSAVEQPPDIVKIAAWLVAAAIVISTLYIGRSILMPLAIAFLIGFALAPLVTWLTRQGFPRLLSVITVMTTVGMVLVGIGILVTSQLQSLSAQLPVYQGTIRQKIVAIGEAIKLSLIHI